ncbi:hypothetical protein Ahy_B07g086589 [Arachis hypogaea]|uniref:Ubiquitin-like protease family profile domain-containing protein n=1 Tax=Arachis hypogaea TaxID=3818 RepID=A0A444YA06_ARAHY|nr:hypothetical protein Ahy_B07g086589 [Arachis hypogaea]
MEIEQQRMTFRRYFIMVVLKMFLNPTSQQTISPWHLPPILDVSNPRRFHWPYHILKKLRDAIRKFQDENRKTCGGCMFVLLVLYFHQLKHGPLHACRVPEPWIVEWITNELDKKADHVISQGCIVNNARNQRKKKKQSSSEAVNERGRCKRTRKDTDQSPSTQGKTTPHPSYNKAEKGCLVNNAMKEKKHKKQSSSKAVNEKAGCKRPFKDTDQSPSIQGKTTSQPSYKEGDKESKTGTRRKLPVCKSRSRRGSNAAPLVVPDSDDDDDVPLARRIWLFQQQPPPHDLKQADPVFKGNHNSHQEANSDLKKGSPQTPPAALVQLSDYDFDRKFDISIVQCPEFEQVLNSVEQGCEPNAIIMHPCKRSCQTNQATIHRVQGDRAFHSFEKTPTPSSLHSIHPTLKKIKLGETKEEQIRTWIVSSSLDKDQDLAKYEGRDYMVIQWMCYSLNDTDSSRFKRDFYCVYPGILESVTRNDSLASFIDGVRPIYDGLSPSFGEDTRFFDKAVAAKRNWRLFPYCWKSHWWVYAFEVNAKRIVILDSLHSVPEDDKRDKLDAYVGRLCEDMANIAIPGFVRTPYGLARSYARVPKQPNNFDCGMCVIKFIEIWTEDRKFYEWDEDSLSSYRMELILDIICGPHNALVHQLVSLLNERAKPVRRNAPRNKKKDVSSPYTAPSTRSLIERVEGLPKGAMRKGRKKLLT